MRNRQFFAPKFAALVVIAVGLMSATALADDQVVQLVSVANGKCLQPENGTSTNGAAIVQVPCDGSAAQFWALHFMSSGWLFNLRTWYQVINQSNHLCLDARGNAVNGTPIQQWTCSGISDEKWGSANCTTNAAGTQTCRLTSQIYNSAVPEDRHPGSHCLATPGAADGTTMVLMACQAVSSQLWKFQGSISDAVKKR
jgi:hypothetical protein